MFNGQKRDRSCRGCQLVWLAVVMGAIVGVVGSCREVGSCRGWQLEWLADGMIGSWSGWNSWSGWQLAEMSLFGSWMSWRG